MKLLITLAATAAALTLAAQAQAARPQHHSRKWHDLTLTQKRQVVARTIRRERGTLRWWLNQRHRFPASSDSSSGKLIYCGAVGTHLPGPICIHADRLVQALHVLRRIDARLAAEAAHRAFAAAERDFETATRVAEAIFPGTGWWLMACAGSEGGHGQWVWNGGAPYSSPNHGSGAGGWMQFMHDTFYGYVDSALATARARGFPLPDSAKSWTSPLGQAVTAAYVRWSGQQGSQWSGASC